MKIVASSNLGKLGAKEGKPVLVPWRWFYSQPTLPLWIGLLLLLVVPKENRKWQVWLILVVPLLAVALRLFCFVPSLGSSANFDLLIQFIVTFAIGWAAVWLLAPYLSTGNRLRAFVSALAVMFAVGLVGYLACFGFSCSMETLASSICYWTTCCVALSLALALSGACCRKTFHSGLIALWLILWLPLVTAICMVVGVFSMFLISRGPVDLVSLVSIGLMVLFGSLFVSGFLYAVNLPVLLLAGLTDCYRERLRAMVFRGSSGDNPFGPTPVIDDRPLDV